MHWLRRWIPPIALDFARNSLWRSKSLRYEGDFPSWEAARNASTGGYDSAEILARVRESAGKVRDGLAAFERDGVCFEKPAYNFPLLACVLRVASDSGNRLRVLDFGGSLGITYYQCRPFLGGLSELVWTVVEQKHFVDCGQREFEDGRLRFRGSIAECEEADVVLISGSLQFLAEPFALLDQLAAVGARWLIVDRTPVIAGDRHVITVQRVPAAIYGREASYPSWLFAANRWREVLRQTWTIEVEVDGSDGRFLRTGGAVDFRFWFCRTHRRPHAANNLKSDFDRL